MGNLAEESRVAFFTGPRKLSKERIPEIKQRLITEMEQLIAQGVCYFCCDGIPGFDELAGLTVLELREKHPQISLVMIHPSHESPTRWMAVNRAEYDRLMASADGTLYVTDLYKAVSGEARKLFLSQQGLHCIAYQNHKTGDTAAVVRLAKKRGAEIINLADGQGGEKDD